MKAPALFVGPLALALAGLVVARALESPDAPADSSAAQPALAPSPATPGAGEEMADQILGINEAISIPLVVVRGPGMTPAGLESHLRDDARATASLGARWVRGHTATTPHLHWSSWESSGRSFEAMDQWVRVAQAEGLRVLGMVGPWPGNKTATFVEAYPPPDPAAYSAFVRAVAERYDGDGVDDMPGLAYPIHDWEVDNEPDLKNTNHTREDNPGEFPATFCTPAQYAEVLRLTAAALREANPAVKVHNGGFYRPMTELGRAYIRALVAEPGVLESIDVVSIHAYFSDASLERLRRAIDTAWEFFPGRPIRVTETSVPSAGEEAWLSQAFQADMVIRVYGEALRQGVDALFWHSLVDPPERDRRRGPGMFSNSLFVAQPEGPPRIKPSGTAYARLAAALREVPRGQVRAEGDGVWLGEAFLLPSGSIALARRFSAVERLWDGQSVEVTFDGQFTRLDAASGALLARP